MTSLRKLLFQKLERNFPTIFVPANTGYYVLILQSHESYAELDWQSSQIGELFVMSLSGLISAVESYASQK